MDVQSDGAFLPKLTLNMMEYCFPKDSHRKWGNQVLVCSLLVGKTFTFCIKLSISQSMVFLTFTLRVLLPIMLGRVRKCLC